MKKVIELSERRIRQTRKENVCIYHYWLATFENINSIHVV